MVDDHTPMCLCATLIGLSKNKTKTKPNPKINIQKPTEKKQVNVTGFFCFVLWGFFPAELGERASRPGLRNSTFSFLSMRTFLNSLEVVEDYGKVIDTPIQESF